MQTRSNDIHRHLSSLSGLWKVLSENDFSHRALISVLYSFIESCDKVKKNSIQCIVYCVAYGSFWVTLYYQLGDALDREVKRYYLWFIFVWLQRLLSQTVHIRGQVPMSVSLKFKPVWVTGTKFWSLPLHLPSFLKKIAYVLNMKLLVPGTSVAGTLTDWQNLA